ncbi:MAG: S-layer homology domain-containing protein, partial [Clostridiales bacterium]|nr:S-layer homology domain-containing protein [Clostridiales bacterium]
MKRMLSSVLAAVMLLQGIVCADAGKTEIYSENFSAFTDGDSATTLGSFKANKTSEQLTVKQSGETKYLVVPSTTAEEQANRFSAAIYTGTLSGEGANEVSVTFEKKENIVSGVRFYLHNSNRNYYELSFGMAHAYTLTKSVSNSRTVMEISDTSSQLNEGMYNLEIAYSSDVIKWRIKDSDDKAMAGTDDLGIDWHTFTVENPFSQTNDTTFALIGGGGLASGSAYTDVKVYSVDELDDGSDWVFKYNDDFSAYDKNTLSQRIGVWASNGKKGILTALSTDLKIADVSYASVSKSSMCVPATNLYNDTANFTTAILEIDVPAGGKQEIKATFKTDAELVTGVRFMVHNDGNNYYEFHKNRNGNNEPGWALIKAVDGARTKIAGGTNGKVLSGTEYTLKLTCDYVDYAGVITWELKTCDGSRVMYNGNIEVTNASGSCEDLNPFKNIGTSRIELLSGAQNAKYSYFTDVSVKATESHEEPPLNENDQASVAAYLARQNSIISAYNTAVNNHSVSEMTEFLVGGGRLALSRMDRVNVTELSDLSADELNRLAERLISYGDTIRFETLSDIKTFEDRIVTEIAIGKLCNVENSDTISTLIDSYASAFGLPVNEYYTSMKESVAERLCSRTFVNAADFKDAFSEAVVMANYNYTINGEYFLQLIQEYADVIGYNKTHFETIDKLGASNAMLSADVKATINNLTDMASWIDRYSIAPTPTSTPTPTPTPNPGQSSGGGGGGGGSFAVLPKQTAAPVKKDENAPLVSAAQIYTDVPETHWAYEAIRFLNARKAVSGYEDGSFKPEGNITRAEFITMLTGIYNIEMPAETAEEEKSAFTDTTETDWYYPGIMAAARAGIMSGDGGMAYPNREITRQEMAVLICKAMEYKGFDINSDT